MSKRDSLSSVSIKKGWLMKQSRGGMMKNWQKRFVVLNNGKLWYYYFF
jgi:hypothetical protein